MRLHMRVCGHRKRVYTENITRRKIPCRTGDSNLLRQWAGPMLYQLIYIPIPEMAEMEGGEGAEEGQ